MTTAERLSRARTLLLLDHPFFGSLALRMPLEPDASVGTMATNGQRIRYAPEFVDQLSDPELMGVLAHGVMHVANGHCWRRGGRDASQWNVATDYAINSLLREAGLTLPQCALQDPAYVGMAAEDVYTRLPPPSGQNGHTGPQGDGGGPSPPPNAPGPASGGQNANSSGSGAPGECQPGQNTPDNQCPDPGGCGAAEDAPADATHELEEEWKVAMSQAAMSARAAGNLPASLQRLVDEIVNPKVPWHVLLRDFVEQSARNDYNWTRPNRRYLGSGIVLPSLVSEELPEIVIAVDTSGSIQRAELDQFAAEVSAVLGAYETTIRLVWCDAVVQKTETLTRADLPLKLEPMGGGGTDFRPVFDWVTKEGIQPACLIYLTDLYGAFPPVEPEYPVMWVCTCNNTKAPWGQVVRM